MANRYRFRYMRERADGTSNETTSRKTFEKWLREREDGDDFFVGWCQWVQCEQDGTLGEDLPHVTKTADADAVENGP